MHKLMGAALLCGALTGCAGMNSDFDCNKTATDQCLSMTDANKLAARGKSLDDLSTTEVTPAKKPVTEPLPVLTNTRPLVSPDRPLSVAAVPARATTTGSLLTPRAVAGTRLTTGSVLTPTPVLPPSALTASYIPVRSRQTDNAGQVAAVRVPDAVQRLWIAPWVDTQDNFHQPAVVEFVKNKAHWDDNFRVIGEE